MEFFFEEIEVKHIFHQWVVVGGQRQSVSDPGVQGSED